MRRCNIRYRNLALCASLWLMCALFTSCFTGIEGTKTIKVNKEAAKASIPKEEDALLADVSPEPIGSWRIGKRFFVASEKIDMSLTPIENAAPASALAGDTILFQGVDYIIGFDGSKLPKIFFTHGIDRYVYDDHTMTSGGHAMMASDHLPMLIDMDMVDKAEECLMKKRLWLRSNIWEDEAGNRLDGKKFVEATVVDVSPGDDVFPLKIGFRTTEGAIGYYMLNFGNSGNESHSVANMFSLTDIRKKYGNISDEAWDKICDGKVAEGMTKQECKLALGAPSDVQNGRDHSNEYDLWIYPDGTTLFFVDGVLKRTGIQPNK